MDARPSFSLALDTDNGSVPPRHRRSARLEIGSDGTGTHTRTHGYGTDERTREAFRLTPEQVATLHADLCQLDAFETPWREAERKTVGGGGRTVRLTLDGTTTQIPRQPVADQRERRDAIVARILAAVPE